jgi:TolB-like protein/Tfp pilus assembly protein PilF
VSDFLERLKQRKLVQWALAYVAAGFALLQGLDIVAQQFGWADGVRRGITIALVVGFFVTLVVAWYHGERGAQRVSGIELSILAILLAIGGVILWRVAPNASTPAPHAADANTSTPAVVPQTSVDRKSIAVLPFTDLSPGHDQEYFSDGMSEEILNALAQVKDLKVAGRTSSFSFKGKYEDLRVIGRTLAVAHVLEGSVRKQGDKVRITAQLIQTSDDTHLWSQTYDGDLGDVFALQERVARAIAEKLQVVLQGDQKTLLVPVATANPEAYLLYLRATEVFNRRDGPRFPNAIDALKEAIRLDPKYARAHARLASLYAVASTYSALDFDEARTASEREARIAIELDPNLAEGYAALGLFYSNHREWLAAQAPQQRAVTLDAADANARFWLATTQLNAGYRTQGTATLEQALAIDPLMATALRWRGAAYRDTGDRDRARRLLQQSVDAGQSVGEAWLGFIAHDEGRDAEAIDYVTRGSRPFFGDFPEEDASRIVAQGMFGGAEARAKAVAVIDRYLARKPKTISGAAPWALLMLGEPARALAVAQDAVTTNDALFFVQLWSLEGRAARRLPQFSEFARKVHLAEYWDKYGPPDGCGREGSGDYVCD